jgi:anti-sigma regulatory factor (Ser/Thr protein kinase)
MNVQRRIVVSDSSSIGAARRAATQIASDSAADETQAGRVAIVASELATNLVRHAGGGELLVQVLKLDSGLVFEFLAIDSGPGMSDPQRCLGDGYSTGGTAGNGLGAIRRLAQFFDVYSLPGRVTVIIARLAIGSSVEAPASSQDALHYGAVCVAVAGETVCGDGWQIAHAGNALALIVADGLGHGLAAHEASNQALQAFTEQPWTPPISTLGRAHERMSSTRGGSVACALADRERGTLSYAGVGNICGSLVGGARGQGLVSHNGTVGAQMRRVQGFEYTFASEQLLVMHSDGLSARWSLSDYPGLMSRHPALIAAVLYREHSRPRDDATVVVARFGDI